MTGKDTEHTRRSLVEAYERTRLDVAEHQVVDAAEDILAHAWLAQLDRERHEASGAVRAAAETVTAARKLLCAADSDGDRRHIDTARAVHARAEQDFVLAAAKARQSLECADERLRALGQATLERVQRRRADAHRLRTAAQKAADAEAGE
jgi:hypothetical protein